MNIGLTRKRTYPSNLQYVRSPVRNALVFREIIGFIIISILSLGHISQVLVYQLLV